MATQAPSASSFSQAEAGEPPDVLPGTISQPSASPHQTSPSISGASEFSPRIGVAPADQGNYAFAPPPSASDPAYMSSAMDIVQPTLNSPESNSSVSVHTLEDNPGRATYFMGRTGEQDPLVLDAFSYGILSEMSTVDASVVQVHRGGSDIDDLPLHFMFLSMGHPTHTNRSRQAASDSVEAMVWPHSDTLVRLYFKHVHPVFPVVSKVRFLRRFATNRKGLPACLRGAVYALASVLWAEDPTMRDRDPCPFKQHEIIEHAHNALRREIENPNLFVLQACLLLIHVQPPSIDAMEAPTTFTFAAQATACAQMIGLHQESNDWDIETVEKKQRRKLWWATYITDCWAAISHGNPPHINESSFNTQMLEIEDIQCDEDVPDDLRHLIEPTNTYFDVAAGARFLESVKITRTLRGVIDRNLYVWKSFKVALTPGSQVDLKTSTIQDKIESQAHLIETLEKLRDWPSLLPAYLTVPINRDPKVACFNSECPKQAHKRS